MKTVLIVDGNYILTKNVFSLAKNNELYPYLEMVMDQAIKNYQSWYQFDKIFVVSDSREKSWRKRIDDNYKGTRKKDTSIDWDFVYQTYSTFKEKVSNIRKVTVLEAATVEGDDWISYLVHNFNEKGISTITITNDYDIKQLVKFEMNPRIINVITNEMMSRQLLFLPTNYEIFLNKIRTDFDPYDIFNQNNDMKFVKLIDGFINKCTVVEINPMECLLLKIISGDKSDNISSVHETYNNGKKRGIGDAGAKTILGLYIDGHGEPSELNDDLIDNLSDVIMEKKKLNKHEFGDIVKNIKKNISMVDLSLSTIPEDINNIMKEVYDRNK